MSTVITLNGVAFEFANGHELFRGLNISLDNGITALVGPNGVGKTTLARLLCGELEPSRGDIRRSRAVAFLPQREEPMAISVEDYLQSNSWSPLAESLLREIDREAPCNTLSGGEWMRVRLSRVLGDQFLILDEPTNDLDRGGRQAILQFLKSHKGGVMLISHDRQCLSLCSEVLELSNRGLSKFGGGWHAYLEERERERHNLSKALDTAKRDRDSAIAQRHEQQARQEKRNRQGAAQAAKGGMPKILIGGRKRRAQVSTGKVDVATLRRAGEAVREAHEALTALKVDPIMYAKLTGEPIPTQKLVAEAIDFNVRFREWLYPQNLNFTWRGPVRLALTGENGSGKSTLLKAILGAKFETRGQLRVGDLNFLYIDQRCASLDDSKSILANVQEVASLSEDEIRNGLARFLFTGDSVFAKVNQLSGGERLRAALARGFLSTVKPELLLLDEPTNNLDLVNIEFLEGLVREFRGALIVISHDEVFLQNCEVNGSAFPSGF